MKTISSLLDGLMKWLKLMKNRIFKKCILKINNAIEKNENDIIYIKNATKNTKNEIVKYYSKNKSNVFVRVYTCGDDIYIMW